MTKIYSGIKDLDNLLDSLYIGDNVVWEVEAGTAPELFILNFIRQSFSENRYVIYVSFNKSPHTIFQKIGEIPSKEKFILLDCFTSGKGKNDRAFTRFYDNNVYSNVIKVDDPRNLDNFTSLLNSLEDKFQSGGRYVFDSLTGMQDLWGDENSTYKFFTYICPRLYDLGTVAYWILEKEAHSPRFKANLRHITQVVFDLSKRKNNLFLKALKLEGRQDREVFKPHPFEIRGETVTIAPLKKEPASDIGGKLKEARLRTGMSQKELADKAGFTPSFLSQLESNQVSPSLGTFIQICRVLGINPGQFLEFGEPESKPWLEKRERVRSRAATHEDSARVYDVISGDKYSVRIVVMPPGAAMNRHFFYHKEEELVYILKGDLSVTIGGREARVSAGDVIRLKDSFPSHWKNEGGDDAELLVLW